MVNATDQRLRSAVLLVAVLVLAALVLTAAAWLRGAEYDEQYTLFLTAGTPRPDWPDSVFPAGAVAALQTGHATLLGIARDLRVTDVHPPLYFWVVSFWRDAFGPSLFAARMLSVLCGLVSLSLVGIIARRCAIPAAAAMALTLGCYGFVYTNAIARGFAPAQMLTLCGILLLLKRRPLLAGLSLGAACCCNYLAVFVATAVIVATGAWVAALTAVPFLALDGWFFAAQHAARTGQFPPFRVGESVVRLAEYQTASVFGGLPLYVDGVWRTAVGAMVGLLAVGLILCVGRARPLNAGPSMRLTLAAAVATPFGLLILGAVFNNTPIELRYLSFGLPFIALLAVWACVRLRCDGRAASSIREMVWVDHKRIRWPAIGKTRAVEPTVSRAAGRLAMAGTASLAVKPRRAWATSMPSWVLSFVITIQFASIAGLLLSPRTTQPARAAAIEAARLVGDGVVLLPRGNDGVGIVGAFGIEAPPALPILLIRPTDPIADRIAQYRRVVVATLAQDRDSTAAIASLRTVLTPPNWRRVAIGSNLEVYERTDEAE